MPFFFKKKDTHTHSIYKGSSNRQSYQYILLSIQHSALLYIYSSTKPKEKNRISQYRSAFKKSHLWCETVSECLCPCVHGHSVALCGSGLRVPFPPDPAHAVGGVCSQMEHKLVRSARFPSRLISVFTLA